MNIYLDYEFGLEIIASAYQHTSVCGLCLRQSLRYAHRSFGFQFYKDVLPVFTQQDSFMKADYLIMSKKIGMGNTISGRSNTFSGSEIDEIGGQKFVKKIGKFTSTEYKVDAQMGVNGVNVLNSELFFESVPDGFVDVPLKDWKYTPGTQEVPIILPRTYINMYNFGFAQSHSLPKSAMD